MKIIKAYSEIMDPKIDLAKDYIYKKIEKIGRICYKSEDRITEDSAAKFVANLVKNHHEAMLEHASMTVKFVVDRGVSHELVRHRMASFAQESTRYCNYTQGKFGGELTFIEPVWFDKLPYDARQAIIDAHTKENVKREIPSFKGVDEKLLKDYISWMTNCYAIEWAYNNAIAHGQTPEQARDILNHSIKTEIVVTANIREWRHILSLRAAGTTGKPHPQMAEVMVPLLGELATYMPELFGDIAEKVNEGWLMYSNNFY